MPALGGGCVGKQPPKCIEMGAHEMFPLLPSSFMGFKTG
jgi:hypothetical protein